jgi:hypothetical protein
MDIVTFTIKFKQDIALLLDLPAASDDDNAQIPNFPATVSGDKIPNSVLTALDSFMGDTHMRPIGDFKTTPSNMVDGVVLTSHATWNMPPGMNFFSFLSEALGHKIRIACPGKNYSSSDIHLIPPTDNPIVNFLAEMVGDSYSDSPKPRLFPDAPWKTDTIVAVIGCDSTDPCCGPSSDWSQCTISVGDTKNFPVASHKPACNIHEIASLKSIVNSLLSKLEEAKTMQEFWLQQLALSLIPLVDGIQDCEDLLESMLTKSETPVWVPGVRMCTADSEEAWLRDPCCNPQKAFEQCCPLQDVQTSVTLIDSVLPDQQCDKTVEALLDNALMSYSMADKLRNDPNAGCTAMRKKKSSPEKDKQLYKFYETCSDILFQGKTKAGNEECNNDDECYTKCQSKTCSIPYGDYESPFFECALDNADPMLLNWIRKTVGVSAAEPLSKLKKTVNSKFAENSCTGAAGANGAVCLLNIPQGKCDANVLNYAPNAGFYSAPAIFVDRTKSDESTCNSASSRQWYSTPLNMTLDPIKEDFGRCPPGTDAADCEGDDDSILRRKRQQNHLRKKMRLWSARREKGTASSKLLGNEYGNRRRLLGNRRQGGEEDGISTTSGEFSDNDYGPVWYAPEFKSEILGCVCKDSNDFECQRVTLDWHSMETLQQDGSPLLPSWSQPPSLKTEFLQDAPDQSRGQCRLSAFDANSQWQFDTWNLDLGDVSPARSISEHLCTALGKTVAKVNGWGVDSVTGYYESFNPEYEWIYNDAEGTYKREQTSPGSQQWCEFDTGCNHRPWDPTAASLSKCVTDYQSDGPKAAQGASRAAVRLSMDSGSRKIFSVRSMRSLIILKRHASRISARRKYTTTMTTGVDCRATRLLDSAST